MARELDANLSVDERGSVACRHCEAELGAADDEYLAAALWRERPAADAPQSVVRSDPSRFVDRPVRLRQAICPGCLTLLLTEVVPTDEPRFRLKRLDG